MYYSIIVLLLFFYIYNHKLFDIVKFNLFNIKPGLPLTDKTDPL